MGNSGPQIDWRMYSVDSTTKNEINTLNGKYGDIDATLREKLIGNCLTAITNNVKPSEQFEYSVGCSNKNIATDYCRLDSYKLALWNIQTNAYYKKNNDPSNWRYYK